MHQRQVLLSKEYLELLINPSAQINRALFPPSLTLLNQEQTSNQIPSPTSQSDDVDEWTELIENVEMSPHSDTLTLDVFSLNTSAESPEAAVAFYSPEQLAAFEEINFGSFNF